MIETKTTTSWKPNLKFEQVQQIIILMQEEISECYWEELKQQAARAMLSSLAVPRHPNIFVTAKSQGIYITSYIPEAFRQRNEHDCYPMWTRQLPLFRAEELPTVYGLRRWIWAQACNHKLFREWIDSVSVEHCDVSIR